MSTHVRVVFYSMYGHTYKMAKAEREGASRVEGIEADIYQVPEIVPEETLEESGALEAKKQFDHVPTIEVEELVEPDGIIFGTPTRFGNMAAQMRNFLDQAGGLWQENELVGKVGSVFTSTATQHGGQETTITSFHTTLFHLGMVVVGVPYEKGELMNLSEISGGSPYGASTLAGPDGSRQPSENELDIARYQGEHVAKTARKLKLE